MLASCVYLAINQLVALTLLLTLFVPSAYCAIDRPTEMLLAASRRKVGPELLWLYKQRVRRAEPDCSNEAESNAEIQQAITTMIIGNDDKSYLSHSVQHKHRSKSNHEKPDMCEEDNGLEEISPDTSIKERALCSFVYVENFNKTRLPQTIPQVQCACAKPTNRLILSRFPNIRCTAIYYNVPVIKFENGCKNFVKTTERLPLACIPILGTQSTSSVFIEASEGEKADIPI